VLLITRLLRLCLKNWRILILGIALLIPTTYIKIYIPKLSGEVLKNVLENRDFNSLVFEVFQILLFTGILVAFYFFEAYGKNYFSQKVVYDVRNDIFKSIQRQSIGFFDKVETGQLMSRSTTDIDRIRVFLDTYLGMLASSIFLLVGVVASMILIDFGLTLLSLSVTPLIFISFVMFGKRIRILARNARDQFGALTSMLWENIVGIRAVRSFTREEYEKQKFHRKNEDYYNMMIQTVKLRSIFLPLYSLIGGVIIALVYWHGGIQVINNRLTIDQLYVFSTYAIMLLGLISNLAVIWSGYQQMVAAFERVFEVIDTKPEVKEKPDAITLPPVEGHVIFENVSFGYDEDGLILTNINLEAKSGETVALLGPTGSGKSTIIGLLLRFYDVTSGRILVDGYDIRDVNIESLRKQMGVVSQEIFLFNKTVKENITYGKPNATIEEIVRAAKIAKAHDFIMHLPNGYDTVIGERGLTLSGGQKQRIAIARALLMDPRILILDDSTSSIDVDTEYEIQQALRALFKNRTAFVITQRVSTIRNSDKIVVLENGRIIEEGTHKSLMDFKGTYHRIYQSLYEYRKRSLKQVK